QAADVAPMDSPEAAWYQLLGYECEDGSYCYDREFIEPSSAQEAAGRILECAREIDRLKRDWENAESRERTQYGNLPEAEQFLRMAARGDEEVLAKAQLRVAKLLVKAA